MRSVFIYFLNECDILIRRRNCVIISRRLSAFLVFYAVSSRCGFNGNFHSFWTII